MNNRYRRFTCGLLGCVMLLLLPGCLGLFEPLFAKGPYRGRVIDTDTKQPIDLTTAYQRVEAYKVNQRMSVNKPQEAIESYESLLDCLKKL